MSSSVCTCNMNMSLDTDLPKHSVYLARLAFPALSGEVFGKCRVVQLHLCTSFFGSLQTEASEQSHVHVISLSNAH